MDDLIAFLRHLSVDATVLPMAPAEDIGRQITHRRADEVHPCLLCGKRARVAYVVDFARDPRDPADTGKRWLDLCFPHASEVLKANEAGSYGGPSWMT